MKAKPNSRAYVKLAKVCAAQDELIRQLESQLARLETTRSLITSLEVWVREIAREEAESVADDLTVGR